MQGGYNSYRHGSSYTVKDSDQPLDTVSCLVWDSESGRNGQDLGFLAGSWDGVVRYYQVKLNSQGSSGDVVKGWDIFLQHPVLSVDMNPDKIMFAGMATGDIAAVDMKNNSIGRIGGHDGPICGVFWLQNFGCLVSLGFDNLIRFWTLDGNERPQKEIRLPLKTHTCDVDFPYLLIGSS